MDHTGTLRAPPRCSLSHAAFQNLGEILFRLSETDRRPVLVLQLGEREAQLPLDSLRREFQIGDESDDGRMLDFIAEALEFVSVLRPGDPLPSEVVTGEASWQPDSRHRALATSRIQLKLAAWISGQEAAPQPAAEPPAIQQSVQDPQTRRSIPVAVDRAAEALGLPNAEAALRLIEDLADELAYVEALRDRLLGRVVILFGKLDRMLRHWRGDASHLETLTQVRRLCRVALQQISGRFEQVDAQTGEVLGALRNADSQRAFIRSQRDWLYRSLRAWEPILVEWEDAPDRIDDGTWALLARTYQFLSPRFMPVTEWLATARKLRRRTPSGPQMVW